MRTTVDLPEDLWRRAKIAAMDQRKDLRRVIIDALEKHLKANLKRGGA